MRPAPTARSMQVCGFRSRDLASPSDALNRGEMRETQTSANFATGWNSSLCPWESAPLLLRLPYSASTPPAIQPDVSVNIVFRHLERLCSASIGRVRRAHAKGCQHHPVGTHDSEREISPHDSRYRGPPMRNPGVRESFPLPKFVEIGATNTLDTALDSIIVGPPYPFDENFNTPGSTAGQWATSHDREPLLSLDTSTTVIRLLRAWRPYSPRRQSPCRPLLCPSTCPRVDVR